MIYCSENGHTLKITDEKSFNGFYEKSHTINFESIKELFITGCIINDFTFLLNMTALEKLVFLACKSYNWSELIGNKSIKILRLHNIKQGKEYLSNIDFLCTFPNLEYLYVNMLGIETFPNVSMMKKLHTICSSNRKLNDYSTMEFAPSLKVFIGWMAVDKHRTSAEAFIPILKNRTLEAFEYTQMFSVEDKKLDSYVKIYAPNIIYPISTVQDAIVDISEQQKIVNIFF